MLSRIIQWRGRVQHGILSEIKHFRDVERNFGRTLDACLRILPSARPIHVRLFIRKPTSTSLNSCMMGRISSSRA